MTEDEQFALALKMSEQEARQVNCREEEEEELVRKAIAESLNVGVPLCRGLQKYCFTYSLSSPCRKGVFTGAISCGLTGGL